MSKIKNGVLDQYGTEPFEQQQFGTAGIEGVNTIFLLGISLIDALLNVAPSAVKALLQKTSSLVIQLFLTSAK